MQRTKLTNVFFLNHGGRKKNKLDRRIKSDNYTLFFLSFGGRLTLNAISSLREFWGKKKERNVERDNLGNMLHIIHQK